MISRIGNLAKILSSAIVMKTLLLVVEVLAHLLYHLWAEFFSSLRLVGNHQSILTLEVDIQTEEGFHKQVRQFFRNLAAFLLVYTTPYAKILYTSRS